MMILTVDPSCFFALYSILYPVRPSPPAGFQFAVSDVSVGSLRVTLVPPSDTKARTKYVFIAFSNSKRNEIFAEYCF